MNRTLTEFIATLSEPRYSSPDHDPAKPFILHGKIGGKDIVFFASPNDPMDYGRELHRRIAAGKLGKIGDYQEPG